ncbi:Aste57867_10153 [Aphanomyces stellatus]|uniref:Aste57867_10153 protein n=1 Tax=Aphanomyces stellatus TaxID=120398 RepID=A0A485KPN2_9STRA|nr:hypothetical protein As57867_010114 [Aphanomyces stellatus]VFT87029.1 Aste57867_10153 [Aphanomyces stellatus]
MNAAETSHLALPPPHSNHSPLSRYNRITRTISLPDLEATCKVLQVTPSSIFRTVWAILLQQYTRSDYVIFGSVVSGRDTNVDGVEKIVGMLINTVPILVQVQPTTHLADLILKVHGISSHAAHHSHCSLIDIKKWANVVQGVDLFDSIMVYENYPSSQVFEQKQRPFSIDIEVAPNDANFHVSISSNALEVDKRYVEFIADRFVFIAKSIATLDVQNIMVESLDQPTGIEKSLIESTCFGPQAPLNYELLHHAFEARAISHPDARAVEHEHVWISYGELNARANILAYELADIGVCVGSRVAVVMKRCLEFIISLLAVLKAGGTIIPLDATFPQNRISAVIYDSKAMCVVTTKAHKRALKDISNQIICVGIDKILSRKYLSEPPNVTRNDEAIVLFTSGSTGQPKGVVILHEGAVNVMTHRTRSIGITEGARVLQFLAIGFDMCQWEIWGALSNGATLVLRDENALHSVSTVDVLICTPTGLGLIGNPSDFPKLKYVTVGGEPLPKTLKDLWAPIVCLINCCGPSECSIMSHSNQQFVDVEVNVGKPIPNVNCYVLDKLQRQVPVGVPGELYIGGIGVSPGYINLYDETTSKFVLDPFRSPHNTFKMYRSGDLARLLPNGHFEILGRQDSQVKLKGYRIELDEVANAIMSHPRVVAAAAIVKKASHLVGFFTPANIEISELHDVVASLLPVYMVPAVWVGLDEMPQNTNGKIDKKALESLDVVLDVEELETDAEKRMAAVWAQVLGVDVSKIGRQTSFFSLGGDSISSVNVVSLCRKIGLSISVAQLVKAATLENVAAMANVRELMEYPAVVLSNAITEAVAARLSSLVINECVVYPVTPMQRSMLRKTMENQEAWQVQTILPMANDMDASVLREAFKTVVESHELLRTSFALVDDTFYQVISTKARDLDVTLAEVSHLNDFLALDWARGFRIGDTYWIRLAIISDSSNQRHAVLTVHHALYDGWSLPLITADILNAYHGHPQVLRPPFRRVVEYIEATKDTHREFWTSYLDGVPNKRLLNWTSSINVEDGPSDAYFDLGSTLSIVHLTKSANDMDVSMSTVLQFAWAATLRHFSHENVVVFGQVMANRSIPVNDVDSIIGPAINCVPCRVDFDDCLDLETQLQRFQTESSAVLAHSFAELDDIQTWCGLDKPLAETRFSFQNLPVDKDGVGGFEHVSLQKRRNVREDTFSFVLEVVPTSKTDLHFCCAFDSEKFTRTHAQEILTAYNHALVSIVGGAMLLEHI